MSYKKQVDC